MSPRRRPLSGPPDPSRQHIRQDPDDGGRGFLPDARRGHARARELLAEMLAEEFLASATSGEEAVEDARDAVQDEELGGPFVDLSDDEPVTPLSSTLQGRPRRSLPPPPRGTPPRGRSA